MTPQSSRLPRLLREPTVHFFLLAALVLAGHRLSAGDPRTIVLTPELKSDLLRRYQDQLNRPPTKEEIAAFLTAWKAEEALYREALREGIDQDDPTVRAVLVSKMRERVLLQMRTPEPTEADLARYLAEHRPDFEAPVLYEHEYVSFPKAEPGAEAARAKAERQLTAGATPASLGLRSTAANVDRERIDQELGREVAEKIVHLPPSRWTALETGDRLLLVNLIRIQGGPPPPAELHARLLAVFKAAQAEKAAAEATRRIAERYHVEEKAK
jgi:hypothetical protein